jgi:hypothetical protein
MSSRAETDLEVLKVVVSKIDESLDKMSQVSTDLSRIIAVHEQRLERLENDHDDRTEDLKVLHKRITESFADLHEKLHAMEDRLDLKYQKQQLNAQSQHDSIQKEIQEDIAELSSRIRTLENWRWWMMGIGVGFGFIAAKVIPMLA